MRGAYYNEIDPYAAQWLRNLIAAGHIAAGDVDERSIEDVKPDDLRGYTQCHFFAGVGVWSYALRLAGVPDTERVWTGSCPCQPFSAAGQGKGFADERHLWPAWHWLISELRPPVIFGEQVASKDANAWLDTVSTDLEALGFAVGALAFPSAGIGAPHIRDRTYFVADADNTGSQGRFGVRQRSAKRPAWARGLADQLEYTSGGGAQPGHGRGRPEFGPAHAGSAGGLADTLRARSLSGAFTGIHRGQEGAGPRHGEPQRSGAARELADAADFGLDGRRSGEAGDGRDAARFEPERLCDAVGLAHAALGRFRVVGRALEPGKVRHADGGGDAPGGLDDAAGAGRSPARGHALADRGRTPDDTARAGKDVIGGMGTGGPGPVNGYWRAADWLLCRDDKWRPVEPGTQPLAHGAPSRVGRLRAYGNAINAQAAAEFIQASGFGDAEAWETIEEGATA